MGPSPKSTSIPGNLLGKENTEVQPGAADTECEKLRSKGMCGPSE